jgi:SET domain-containing protein
MPDAMPLGPRFPLGVEQSPERGRCLVALVDIPAGAVIETAPVQVLPAALTTTIDAYRDYFVLWEDEISGRRFALPLGLLGLCNHSAYPNAALLADGAHRLIRLVAMRDIRAGQEITVRYRDPVRSYAEGGK